MQAAQDRLSAIFWALLAVAIYVYSDRFPAAARLFPLLIAGAIAVCSVAMFALSFRRNSAAAGQNPIFLHRRRFAIAFGASVGYAILMSVAGYFTATFLYVIALPAFLGYRRYRWLLATGGGFVAFVYLVFVLIFSRPLPAEFFQAY
ncbi:MAG: tripartite tricarboxylate transporter TctB family protein [Proteobacteria bacterium]|nr:tripartite tricarboxylate transporter TctB family protein [Pseudomonadota bacterium]